MPSAAQSLQLTLLQKQEAGSRLLSLLRACALARQTGPLFLISLSTRGCFRGLNEMTPSEDEQRDMLIDRR